MVYKHAVTGATWTQWFPVEHYIGKNVIYTTQSHPHHLSVVLMLRPISVHQEELHVNFCVILLETLNEIVAVSRHRCHFPDSSAYITVTQGKTGGRL